MWRNPLDELNINLRHGKVRFKLSRRIAIRYGRVSNEELQEKYDRARKKYEIQAKLEYKILMKKIQNAEKRLMPGISS